LILNVRGARWRSLIRMCCISYPFGGYNATAVQAANDAGFHLAVTTVRGKVKPGDNPFFEKAVYLKNGFAGDDVAADQQSAAGVDQAT
jgi:peptidoglycan/xylan/chitin deacetylase (PgdA/CDA1 family)